VDVAVVAHATKSLGGGLPELRRVLAAEGIADPIWFEVDKSRRAPARVRRALKQGAELVFVWGGDGTVQRCADVLAGSGVPMAILPAGTANLFATNLDIPKDVEQAVAVGLRGRRRSVDLGRFAGEHFGVMAGVGFDAAMIRDADRGLKDRVGRLAYVWTGARSLHGKPFRAIVEVDGLPWYDGDATAVLIGNAPRVLGGVEPFSDPQFDDGLLEVGVVDAYGVLEWATLFARTVTGEASASKFARETKAHKVKIELDRKEVYELDGGDRKPRRTFKAKVVPGALEVCVPD